MKMMLRRNKEAIFIINPSLRRSNSLPQLSCKKEREEEVEVGEEREVFDGEI